MAENSWPFENIDTTETQYSLLFSEFQDNGVAGDNSNPASIAVSVAAGMVLTVSDGFAVIRGFAYQNTADLSLTVDAADAQPRIDTVVLRLDPSVNSIVAAIKKGTAAASPSAPALTQTPDGIYELPLANILVPASVIALDPGNLTDRRQFLGSHVGLWFTASRPSSPDKGRFGYNLTTGKLEWYDGSAWSNVLPLELSGSQFTDGSITNAKLATKPGTYPDALTTASTSLSLTANTYAGGLIVLTAGTATTVTIASTALAVNQRIDFIQQGTGQVTFAAGAGATLVSPDSKLKTRARYSAVSVVCIASGSFVLVGDLTA